jgi:DNA-binding NtrC family response regulator
MKRILIVDDEENIRNLIRESIESDQYEIHESANGDQASILIEKHAFNLVVTDIVMPEMNGINLIMAINKRNPGIPVIAISGGGGITGRFDYLPIAKLIGALFILEKPFDITTLRNTIEKALTLNAA